MSKSQYSPAFKSNVIKQYWMYYRQVYAVAKTRHPHRWSGSPRKWTSPQHVYITKYLHPNAMEKIA